MAWWYWFGMWIAGITGLIVAWWLCVDAYRSKGSSARFAWPVAAVAGVLLQIPAFAVSSVSRSTSAGTVAAVVGVLGTVLIGIAAVSHFTVSGGQTGSGWSTHTRDQRTGTSDQSAERRRREPARAAVPITKSRRAGSAHGTAEEPATSSTSASGPAVSPAADASASPNAFVDLHGEPGATEVEEPEGSSAVAPTIDIDSDSIDPAGPTMVDEPELTQLEDEETPEGPQLVITGGTSSRIIVTERSGPFKVGRDPSKATLAVDDGRVSRVHFVIDRIDDRFLVSDYGSSNGTFVNGSAVIEPKELKDGDVIEFGRTIATFTMPQARER